MINPDAFALVNRIAVMLPTPLVGSVLYDGHKESHQCTLKAFEAFEECMALAAPTRILEIGTHAGGSALLMLALTQASMVSVDIGHTWITPGHSFADWDAPSKEGGLLQVARVLDSMFPNRFNLIVGDSTAPETLKPLRTYHAVRAFDMAFIDGNHAYDYVKKDIQMVLGLGVRSICMDDWNGDAMEASDSKRAALDMGLILVKEWRRVHSTGVGFALLRAPVDS